MNFGVTPPPHPALTSASKSSTPTPTEIFLLPSNLLASPGLFPPRVEGTLQQCLSSMTFIN